VDTEIMMVPVQLPKGKYCISWNKPHDGCKFHSNHLEVGTCVLGFSDTENSKEGLLKSKECLNLLNESEYKNLIKDHKKLSALESGGVDNWEWYDQAMEDFYEN